MVLSMTKPCNSGSSRIEAKEATFADTYCSLETKIITIDPQRWDPASATLSIILNTALGISSKSADIVLEPMRELRRREQRSVEDERARAGPSSRTSGASRSSRPASETSSAEVSVDETHSEPSVAPSSETSSSTLPSSQGARVALAGSKAVLDISLFSIKTIFVDLPLSTTEGLLAIPKRTYDRNPTFSSSKKPITGIASGLTAAYINFSSGMYSGATSIVRRTYEGKKREGALGAAKGIGMGVCDLVCKTSAGAIGLVAYPMLGGWRSLHKLANHRARDAVVGARLAEGDWLVEQGGESPEEVREVIQRFAKLTGTGSYYSDRTETPCAVA